MGVDLGLHAGDWTGGSTSLKRPQTGPITTQPLIAPLRWRLRRTRARSSPGSLCRLRGRRIVTFSRLSAATRPDVKVVRDQSARVEICAVGLSAVGQSRRQAVNQRWTGDTGADHRVRSDGIPMRRLVTGSWGPGTSPSSPFIGAGPVSHYSLFAGSSQSRSRLYTRSAWEESIPLCRERCRRNVGPGQR